MTDADLKFNVYLPENTSDELTEADADSVTKANDQLGINIFDDYTDKNGIIHTKAIYDASQLSALAKKDLKIRWTIELQCKQDSYNTDLNLLSYLNNITVKGVDEATLATLSNSSSTGMMETSNTKWHYTNNRAKFEETDNPGLFDIRLPRKQEKCQIPQDILCLTKRLDRRNTVCIARERLKVRHKKDKEDGTSEVSEEVYLS